MSINLFEVAARAKFRFQSDKGPLTAEQLWDLPLQSKSTVDLDAVAKAVNAELKSVTEESFVATANPKKATLENKLELVKYIIGVRIAENEAKANASAKAAERAKLVDALDAKQNEELKGLTREQIVARLAELDK